MNDIELVDDFDWEFYLHPHWYEVHTTLTIEELYKAFKARYDREKAEEAHGNH